MYYTMLPNSPYRKKTVELKEVAIKYGTEIQPMRHKKKLKFYTWKMNKKNNNAKKDMVLSKRKLRSFKNSDEHMHQRIGIL